MPWLLLAALLLALADTVIGLHAARPAVAAGRGRDGRRARAAAGGALPAPAAAHRDEAIIARRPPRPVSPMS